MKLLGIDIGGSGVKGAVVDTKKGVFITDRLRIETPRPATPDAVAKPVRQIIRHLEWDGPVGCTFPGVVRHGSVYTAANMSDEWIGIDAAKLFGKVTDLPFTVINDADAAGVAEASFGAARHREGVVVLVTLGTGIGTAVLVDGVLVPNTELGHLPMPSGDAEKYAAESVRDRENLGWEEWAARLTEYFRLVEDLLWPDLFVVGGGISKNPDPWLPLIACRTPIVPARLRNKAGIIGAALQADRDRAAAHPKKR